MNGKFVKSFIIILFLTGTPIFGIDVPSFHSSPQSENSQQSINDLYALLINNPMNIEARFELAKQFYLRKDYKNTLLHLEYLIPVTESSEITLFYENVKSEYEGVAGREIARYLKLLESMPVNKATAELIYKNEKIAGEFDHSERILTEYLRLAPDDIDIQKLLVEVYLSTGKLEEAYDELNSYLVKHPEDEAAEYKMYILAAIMDKYSKRFEDYFYSNPKDESLIYLALIEQKKQNTSVELDYLRSYEGENYFHPDIVNMLYIQQLNYKSAKEEKGNILQEARDAFLYGECKNSAELFNSYLEEYEPDSLILLESANANFCAENYGQASELFDDFISTYTGNDDQIKKRAKSFQKSRQNFKALDDYLYLLEKYPEDEDVLTGLARTYNQAGLYSESKKYYQKANDLFPTSFYIIDEMDALPEFDKRKSGFLPNMIGYEREFSKKLSVLPLFSHYSDSEGYLHLGGGVSARINLLRILQLEAQVERYSMENYTGGQNYSSFGGIFSFSPVEFITLETYFGSLIFGGNDRHFQSNSKLKYHTEFAEAHVGYFSGDGVNYFHDKPMVFNRINTQVYEGEGYLYFPKGMTVGAKYEYVITDKFQPDETSLLAVTDNIGNELAVIGKIRVFDEYFAGYEYFYADYEKVLEYYYTPQDYIEHKLTFETPFFYFDPFYLKLFGKLGVVPENTLFTKKIGFELKGTLAPKFTVSAGGGLNWEYRFLESYSSRYLNISFQYDVL